MRCAFGIKIICYTLCNCRSISAFLRVSTVLRFRIEIVYVAFFRITCQYGTCFVLFRIMPMSASRFFTLWNNLTLSFFRITHVNISRFLKQWVTPLNIWHFLTLNIWHFLREWFIFFKCQMSSFFHFSNVKCIDFFALKNVKSHGFLKQSHVFVKIFRNLMSISHVLKVCN